jgi:hypothetical protein
MNYAELATAIEDTTENTFTDAQVKLFVQQAEQAIQNAVDLPTQRKTEEGTSTSQTDSGVATLTMPTDYLYTYSIAVKNNNLVTFLLNKDVNFIQEAYPSTLTANRGVPVHYAQYGADTLVFGPTPDAAYDLIHTYAAYPTSIAGNDKTATTTSWLGDNFDSVLLNGALVEAARFMKSDADIVGMYDKMYQTSMQLLKNLGDGKLRGDAYRNGQPKTEVL